MTAHHEAPTLDVATDRHIKEDETIETLAEIHPAALVRSLATELLEHRKRLRAIENAKGVPEEPKWFVVPLAPLNTAACWKEDYDTLRLHAQHLQDRLNRMEAALTDIAEGPQPMHEYLFGIRCGVEDRCLQDNVYEAAEYAFQAGIEYSQDIAAALLAKVGGRE